MHCNAFFPMYLMLYVLQLALCPLLLMHSFLACLLSAGAAAAVAGCGAFCPSRWCLAPTPARLLTLVRAHPARAVLYAAGISYYFYITFLGYSALPFLERTEVRLLIGRRVGPIGRA